LLASRSWNPSWTATGVPSPTASAAPAPTFTTPPSPTPTTTPTLPPFMGWSGLGNVSFHANFAEMTVQQSGTRVSGSLAFGPHHITFTGTTSQDGRVLTGRWQGEKYWQIGNFI